jgi:membrane protein DedA with SNARE-associated domain
MEMQNIVIFALIGAVCMFIVTGGVISMTSEDEPSSILLASGATTGGIVGAAISYMTSTLSANDFVSGYSAPDMKVGLPTF